MRPIYLSLAGLTFALAVLGVFLPLLPTTPFLLVTSWCLVRSSPALNDKLMRSPVFGAFLSDWQRYRGVRAPVKWTALATLTTVVVVTLWLGDVSGLLQGLLVGLAAIGVWVILRLRTIPRDPCQ